MAEHPVTCPQCGHTSEIKVVLDFSGDAGDQLVAALRERLRRDGGAAAAVLAKLR